VIVGLVVGWCGTMRFWSATTVSDGHSVPPHPTVKDCELEREQGKIIWSFAFTTPDSRDNTEVNGDATTGNLANVEHEKAK